MSDDHRDVLEDIAFDPTKLEISAECQADETFAIHITNPSGKNMMNLTYDGELIFAESVTPEDTAKVFADSVSHLLGRKTREDVEEFVSELPSGQNDWLKDQIVGRMLKWLGIEE